MGLLGEYTRKQAVQIALGILGFLGVLANASRNNNGLGLAGLIGSILGGMIGVIIFIFLATEFYDYTKGKFFKDNKIKITKLMTLGFTLFITIPIGFLVGAAINSLIYGFIVCFVIAILLVIIPISKRKNK
jgi:hypothetical protein